MKLKWDLDWWLLGLTGFSLGLKWLYINYNLARWPMKKLAEFFSKTFAGFNLFFFNEMFYSMFISIIEPMKTNSIGVFSTKKKLIEIQTLWLMFHIDRITVLQFQGTWLKLKRIEIEFSSRIGRVDPRFRTRRPISLLIYGTFNSITRLNRFAQHWRTRIIILEFLWNNYQFFLTEFYYFTEFYRAVPGWTGLNQFVFTEFYRVFRWFTDGDTNEEDLRGRSVGAVDHRRRQGLLRTIRTGESFFSSSTAASVSTRVPSSSAFPQFSLFEFHST